MQFNKLLEALLDVAFLSLTFEDSEAIHSEGFHLAALHLLEVSFPKNFPLGIVADMSLIDVDFFHERTIRIPRVQQYLPELRLRDIFDFVEEDFEVEFQQIVSLAQELLI